MLLSLEKSFDERSQEPRDAVAGRLADSVRRVNRADAWGELRLQRRRPGDLGDRVRRLTFNAKVGCDYQPPDALSPRLRRFSSRGPRPVR